MEKLKYELTNITMEYEGRTLYRIKALKSFDNVLKGSLGGWVSNENNLSQEGRCWIYSEAKCMDDSRMYDNSKMFYYSEMHNNSEMHDESKMFCDSKMFDNSKKYGNSIMGNNCEMHDNSTTYDDSSMNNNSKMYDNSSMYNNSSMYDDSLMRDNSSMHEHSEMYNESIMFNDSEMHDNSEMHDKSKLYNDSILKSNEKLYGILYSKCDKYFNVQTTKGKLITIIFKDGQILYNIGLEKELTKDAFIKQIHNTDKYGEFLAKGDKNYKKGLELCPHRQEYLNVINASEILLGLQ